MGNGNKPPALHDQVAESDSAHRAASGRVSRRSPNVAQAVLLGSALTQLGLALVVTIYLARVLSPAAFGFFSLVGTIFVLARKFLDLGLSNVAARDIAHDARRERPILEGMMAYRRVAGVVLAVGLFVAALRQHDETMRWVLVLVGLVLLDDGAGSAGSRISSAPGAGWPSAAERLRRAAGVGRKHFLSPFGDRWSGISPSCWWLREAFSLLFTKVLAERFWGIVHNQGFADGD